MQIPVLNKRHYYLLDAFIGQEKKFLEAAKAGRVEEVAAFLDQGVDIKCIDKVC